MSMPNMTRADVRTGLEYLALQARANGLNFVTEAGRMSRTSN